MDFNAEENAEAPSKNDFDIVVLAPNPTSAFTRLTVESRVNQVVRMEVFDLNGKVVELLYEGELFAGQTRSQVVTTDRLQAGVYTVRVASPWHTDYRKLIVTR